LKITLAITLAIMIAIVPMLTTTQKAHATQEEWNQGDADGRAQARFDSANGNPFNSHCGFEHSDDYCTGYKIGYTANYIKQQLIH
jgi:hypothetical protein